MRLIDALELKRSISVSMLCEDGKHIFDIIDEQPTIELKKGKWMDKLKPCPFCGSIEVKMYSSHDPSIHGFIHICEIGGDGMVKVESRLFSTEQEAIEAWNRRIGE